MYSLSIHHYHPLSPPKMHHCMMQPLFIVIWPTIAHPQPLPPIVNHSFIATQSNIPLLYLLQFGFIIKIGSYDLLWLYLLQLYYEILKLFKIEEEVLSYIDLSSSSLTLTIITLNLSALLIIFQWPKNENGEERKKNTRA